MYNQFRVRKIAKAKIGEFAVKQRLKEKKNQLVSRKRK
jgi:hypothetical protein